VQRGIVYFTEAPLKACFQKGLKENEQDLQGFILALQDPHQGSRAQRAIPFSPQS
jgi:hypothetical protein